MNNKLIVIEGLDGGGKTTQLELLKSQYPDYRFITFPNYGSPSGEIVTNYLQGKYKENDNTVSAYTASCFYAVDRYTSYKTDWEKDYKAGIPVISARYVSSNAIYQMTKLPQSGWEEYMDWLFDTEYNKFGIPRPNGTVFLDMPVEVSQKLLMKRYNGDKAKMDLHESDLKFMNNCRAAALYVAEKENWRIISCAEGGEPLPIDLIHQRLKKEIKELLK
ncbi:MAG: deoxynucleoside kinase [Firmicutes bacterium]|nr:deoxynucleoside kinase [[Eubacterium] siraeum]MCM1487578.1 deoxynucleoside kinase [Bacillota bacterium]